MFNFFAKSEKRSSPENPNVSLADSDIWDMFGASVDGVSVNKKTAFSNTAQWAAVGRRSRTIGSLSCKVYKRTELGSEPDTFHPVYNLINRQPHPLYNSFVFFQTLVTNLDTCGRAFAEIVRNRSGAPVRLNIIEPDAVQDLQETTSGNYFFIIQDRDRLGHLRERVVALSDMIWIKGQSFDGITSLNPTQVHKDTLGAGLAASRYANSFYENNAHINYAIEVPFAMSATAKTNLESSWSRLFSGLKNAWRRPFFADKGMKLHPLKMTPADAALVESKKQTVEEIARINDVPPHMVGAGERFTFSSVEVMVTDFVQYSLRNTTRQLEIELENKLLTDAERGNRTHEIRFNIDSLLQGDIKTRTEKLVNEVKWGLINKNEYRKMQGYNEVNGGDVYLNPVNMFVSREGEEPVNPIQVTDEQ